MELAYIFQAWGRILQGRQSVLSIEITKECPLACPGCYAYQPNHVSGQALRSLADRRKDELVEGVLELIDTHRPLLVYIVGGEPLVRFRELNTLLPLISRKRVRAEVVTSAVRPIPREWREIEGLEITVSIDGLQQEHDARRAPATYERILKHIEGHEINVHCTITAQMMRQSDYLDRFVEHWHDLTSIRAIRMSLFTPQVGEECEEILDPAARQQAVDALARLQPRYPKLRASGGILKAFLNPPSNPSECTFAEITRCVSADLQTVVTPCQLGGTPDCQQCGCVASAGVEAVRRHKLPGGLQLGSIFKASRKIGAGVRYLRTRDFIKNGSQ